MKILKKSFCTAASEYTPGSSAYSGPQPPGVCSLSDFRRKGLQHRASLTLEAALALPLFLFFILAILSFLMMLQVQMQVQNSMEDLSRRMGKSAYLIERGEGILNGGELDADAASLAGAGLNGTSIRLFLAADHDLSSVLNSSRVKGGSSGIYTYASEYDSGSGILDMVVSYDYDVPWLPGFFGNIRIVQRARSHVWTGDRLQKNGGNDAADHKTVYVTETGTVYHTSPDCHYLDLSIREVSSGQVAGMRNASGAKYYPCEECSHAHGAGTVYITDYGTSWHTSLSCSGLKRTIREVDVEELGDMKMCSKCAAFEAHSH